MSGGLVWEAGKWGTYGPVKAQTNNSQAHKVKCNDPQPIQMSVLVMSQI